MTRETRQASQVVKKAGNMPEAKLPPFIKSMSGKLGDVVYRVSKKTGKTYVSRAPEKSTKKPTAAQLRQQERLALASKYASQAKDDPVYQERARKTGLSASNAACSDWLHGPVIHDVARRSGCIRIDASDNVHVAKVQVTITDEAGNFIEQGEAAQTFGGGGWEFETVTEGKILVEVWDLAGNAARWEA
jgi:hypothetical protein